MRTAIGRAHRQSKPKAATTRRHGAVDTLGCSALSPTERAQLGQPSNSRTHPSKSEWLQVRQFLLDKSTRRDPLLRPEMTAYTPGETLALMQQPSVRSWQQRMRRYAIPADAKTVVFVPCAATKPWDTARNGIYKSYNRLRAEMQAGNFPKAYFVTISEPLGIVPEDEWGRFPRYDNPGLFRNDSARAGRTTTREWWSTFGKNFVTPFDEKAYDMAIDRLSDVIADFARTNAAPGRRFISFVDDAAKGHRGRTAPCSTHTDMLRRADRKFHFIDAADMHPKRAAPRQEPYPLLRRTLLTAAGWPSKRYLVKARTSSAA